jgi:chromosome partitioning protein
MSTLRLIKKSMNPRLEIFGILLTMYDGRTNLSFQVAEEVRKHFPGKVFSTVIPRNVRLSEAPSYGLPVTAYDKLSRGAEAYVNLAAEVLKKKS